MPTALDPANFDRHGPHYLARGLPQTAWAVRQPPVEPDADTLLLPRPGSGHKQATPLLPASAPPTRRTQSERFLRRARAHNWDPSNLTRFAPQFRCQPPSVGSSAHAMHAAPSREQCRAATPRASSDGAPWQQTPKHDHTQKQNRPKRYTYTSAITAPQFMQCTQPCSHPPRSQRLCGRKQEHTADQTFATHLLRSVMLNSTYPYAPHVLETLSWHLSRTCSASRDEHPKPPTLSSLRFCCDVRRILAQRAADPGCLCQFCL